MMYKTSGGDYKPYREVWQGLPVAVSDLKKVKGQGIYYCNADGFMLVVPHDILRACRQDPKAILRVLITKAENGRKHVEGIWTFEGSLEDAIADAEYWNYDDVSCGKGKRVT